MSVPALRYTVERLDGAVDYAEYLRDGVKPEVFLPYCTRCPRYGRVWSCPPYDFDPMEVWRRYRALHLYARLLRIGEPGQPGAAAIAASEREKGILLDELLVRERETPGSLALSGGACLFCTPCARERGLPCAHPARMRPSLESLGGDVGLAAARYLGHPLLWAGETAPEYLLVVGGLLT